MIEFAVCLSVCSSVRDSSASKLLNKFDWGPFACRFLVIMHSPPQESRKCDFLRSTAASLVDIFWKRFIAELFQDRQPQSLLNGLPKMARLIYPIGHLQISPICTMGKLLCQFCINQFLLNFLPCTLRILYVFNQNASASPDLLQGLCPSSQLLQELLPPVFPQHWPSRAATARHL